MSWPPILQISWAILRALPQVVVYPQNAWLFWLVVVVVYFFYRRSENLERALYGQSINKALSHTFTAVGHGIAGGFIGSVLFVALGATLTPSDVGPLWLVALALMLLAPRFICFAYAGGIISLASLAFGWPQVNVPALLTLVAILHLVEGLLVAFDRDYFATPVYIKHEQQGVAGAFLIQRFWPVPITVILLVSMSAAASQGIQMPDWWPLIPPLQGRGVLDTATLAMVPVVAVLGYGDLAITQKPRARSRQTALGLLVFSGILLALSLASTVVPLLAWMAALFSPLAHEFLAEGTSRFEFGGQPFFLDPGRGVRVLATMPSSPARELGLQPGDVITRVNGTEVNTASDLRSSLAFNQPLSVSVQREEHQLQLEGEQRPGSNPDALGLILVPPRDYEQYMQLQQQAPYQRLWRWIQRFWRRDDDG